MNTPVNTLDVMNKLAERISLAEKQQRVDHAHVLTRLEAIEKRLSERLVAGPEYLTADRLVDTAISGAESFKRQRDHARAQRDALERCLDQIAALIKDRL